MPNYLFLLREGISKIQQDLSCCAVRSTNAGKEETRDEAIGTLELNDFRRLMESLVERVNTNTKQLNIPFHEAEAERCALFKKLAASDDMFTILKTRSRKRC